MGYGATFNSTSYKSLSSTRGYRTKSSNELFENRTLNNKLDPKKMNNRVRESRDSEEHPEALPIIIGLDVTGSMGRIPYNLIKNDLPKLMTGIIDMAHKDPQMLFLGIGDGYFDSAPIQISQFESETELIATSLTDIFLEGGGGGNKSESYSYAWLIGSRHTSTDRNDKHNKKGFLFTIGDEQCNEDLYNGSLVNNMGYEKGTETMLSKDLYEEVTDKYHVFHIHCDDGNYSVDFVRQSWIDIMGQNFLHCKSDEIVQLIAKTIKETLAQDNDINTSDKTIEEEDPKFL